MMSVIQFEHRKRRQPQLLRRAAAAVELAVCLPIIVILVFGALEGANIMFCRQAMVQAAYEACKHASRVDGTSAGAKRLAQDVLTARRVKSANITLSPADVSTTQVGQDVTVRITVNSSSRTFTGLGLFSGRLIDVSATMQKE
jgi:Flp pilus assembly protein TadG